MRGLLAAGLLAGTVQAASAFTITLESSGVIFTPGGFNEITSFSFVIDVAAPLVAGQTYLNPALNGVDYSLAGTLSSPTPSGFPTFALNRPETPGVSVSGTEFYGQGSLLQFGISGTANLGDGLQVSELSFFGFDGREFGTGRYHPPVLGLWPDGSGILQNSTNVGGVNPATLQMVNVDFGDEYWVEFSADPSLTLSAATPVPGPGAAFGLISGLGVLVLGRRRVTAG